MELILQRGVADVVARQVLFWSDDRVDVGAVRLLDRVAQVAPRSHGDARLQVELILEVDDHIRVEGDRFVALPVLVEVDISVAVLDRGCQQKAAVTGQLGNAVISVLNPVVAPGDFFHIEVKLPEGASAEVKIVPPEGWTAPDGAQRALKAGMSRCDVQVPRTAKKGNQTITFQQGEQKLELKVDVVSWVKG